MAECHCLSLCDHHIMVLLIQFFGDIFNAGRVKGADYRASQSQHILFIDGHPEFCTVTEVFEHDLCEIDKSIDCITVSPTAFCLNSSGQIKMVHRDQRLNVVFQALIDQVVIVFNTFGIDSTCAFGNQTRPGNRETVGFESHFCHQLDIFLIVVILVRSHLKIRRAFGNHLDILYRRALSVLKAGALNLISGSGSTPEKIFREITMFFCHLDTSFLSDDRKPYIAAANYHFYIYYI